MHLFHRKYKDRQGNTKEYSTYTAKYYIHGKPKYYNTKETNKRKAKDKAEAYIADVKKGSKPWEYDKITFDNLKEMLILDYEINEKKSLDSVMHRANNLSAHFKGYKAQAITTDEALRYIKKRQKEGRANSTINRELAALKRMFNLAHQQSPPKVAQVPYIPMLQENNIRTGFFEHEEYQSLMSKIASYLRGVITLAYETGMRKEEILSLKWEQVDMRNKTLRLEDTKSGKRILKLSLLMQTYLRVYKAKNMANGNPSEYVFLNRDGTDRIKDLRGAWQAACAKAGLGKRHFHDFRRTAVRNMVRAEVPENIAMRISGHKTRSVFDRYNIVNEKDIEDALNKTQEYLRTQARPKSKKVVSIKR